jgi:hypothetical protein
MSADDLMTEVITEVRALDAAMTRWDARGVAAREAATTAVMGIDLLVAKLHRLRDQVTREVRAYDQQHRPHDPRD